MHQTSCRRYRWCWRSRVPDQGAGRAFRCRSLLRWQRRASRPRKPADRFDAVALIREHAPPHDGIENSASGDRFSISPCENTTFARPSSLARFRARASGAASRSIPATDPCSPTSSRQSSATSPLPQPTSSTRMPAEIPASTSSRRVKSDPMPVMRASIKPPIPPQSPSSHSAAPPCARDGPRHRGSARYRRRPLPATARA
jgi:hypothetical protein